jgi:diguanylate cyclase (GGDEF)-like protein
MLFDQTSLLLAIGFAGGAVGITLLIAWFSSRSDKYLFHLALGVGFIVAGVVAFSTYRYNYSVGLHLLAFGLMLTGFSILTTGARRFRTGSTSLQRSLATIVGVLAVIVPPFSLGFDGLGAIFANILCAGLLIVGGLEFWRAREEAPVLVRAIVALYGLTATTFVLCAIALVLQGDMILPAAPSNWAEEINAFVGIFSMSGIGGLSLALNQSRLARRHRSAAMTDALTGLLNRRALFDRFGAAPLPVPTAVLLCDLDHFKSVNDRHGHAAGDDVLRQFAATVRKAVRASDAAARQGGEEFAIIMPGSTAGQAAAVAERIRTEFAGHHLETLAGALTATVSIGVASCEEQAEGLESLLGRADAALYVAKRDGRNRVTVRNLQRVA